MMTIPLTPSESNQQQAAQQAALIKQQSDRTREHEDRISKDGDRLIEGATPEIAAILRAGYVARRDKSADVLLRQFNVRVYDDAVIFGRAQRAARRKSVDLWLALWDHAYYSWIVEHHDEMIGLFHPDLAGQAALCAAIIARPAYPLLMRAFARQTNFEPGEAYALHAAAGAVHSRLSLDVAVEAGWVVQAEANVRRTTRERALLERLPGDVLFALSGLPADRFPVNWRNIVRNVVSNRIRKEYDKKCFAPAALDDAMCGEIEPGYLGVEVAATLEPLIGRAGLTEDERRVVLLFAADKTESQIAKELDKPIGTVRGLKGRAMKKLSAAT